MKMRVLLVEDNTGDAKMAERALVTNTFRFDVTTAATLSEARAALDRDVFDAVCLDLRLPDSDGLATLLDLQPAEPPAVVVLTSIDDEDLGLDAVRAGAQDYVLKDDAGWTVLPRVVRYSIERHRMREELADVNGRLRRFIAFAAHELRSPVATVINAAQALADSQLSESPEVVARLREALERQTVRVDRLTRDLLDLSHGMHGVTELEAVDLAACAEEALSLASPPEGRNVTIDVPPGTFVRASTDFVVRIITNLLTNAYRYGGPNVHIDATRDDGVVRLGIADDGDGVPEQLVPKLFQYFQRGGERHPESSGLGLAIVRELAESLGGAATYDRSASGARFVITLDEATP